MTDTKREAPASPEKRAAALELVLRRKADMPENFVAEFTEHADDAWITANGAQMVARAWTDLEYRARILVDGPAAARELGFEFPEHHRNLVVLENTPTVHNVIVCTLCSCTAYTIIGAAPDWYKDLDYRARVVRESRTVLREMGLDLPATTQIRVWEAVQVGSEATITTPVYTSLTFRSRVAYIDPRVDAQTRTARVRVEVPNRDGRLRLGMYVSMVFTTRGKERAIVVPRAAVQALGERMVVYLPVKDEEGRFIQREIRVGQPIGDGYTVLAGLRAGDVVVTEGSFFLRAESLRNSPSG